MGDINRFKVFADFIERNYKYNKNILDVAGGQGGLSIELKRKGYNPTIIDPKIKSNINNVNKIKGYYTDNINIDYDLVVGMHPDGATEYIVRNAVKNNKKFAVVPCCIMPINKKLKMNYHEWINYLYNIAGNNVKTAQLPIGGMNIVIYN
ncbi:MAG: hypothetical protein PHT02_01020 [Tissierellia bacterium]|nr:hypothetical protein [Tissierellia bacterium]